MTSVKMKKRGAKAGNERRRFRRKILQLPLFYQRLQKGNVSGWQESLSYDVGAGGLALVAEHNLPKDQLLMVSLVLPPKNQRSSKKEHPLHFEKSKGVPATIFSRVAWCSERKKDGVYTLGVQFLDLDQVNRKRLKSFLVDLQLDRKHSLLYR